MQLTPYLFFNGNCAEAFRFYERTFGGKIVTMQTHGETPARDHVPAEQHDAIMHAYLTIGDMALMGSDDPTGYKQPRGFSVSIGVTTVGEARRIFAALEEGGRVTVAFDKTFWSPGFGMVVDRFGTPWMVNTVSPV